MANNERLTKRVKKIEEWVAENEEMGGPKGYLDTMVSLYNSNLNNVRQGQQVQINFDRLRSYTFEFIEENKLSDEWNEFLKEKDNPVQAEGEEPIEAPKENKKE